MSLISQRTVKLIRQTVEQTLTDVCTIQRETDARGTMGDVLHTLETVASDVPCRIIRAGEQTRAMSGAQGDQESITDRVRIVLAHDVTVDVDYVLTVSGVAYQVVAIEDQMSDAAFVGCVCVRVR